MSRHSISVSLAALLLVVAAVLAVVQHAAPKPLNVIFLTVESFRADAIGPERTPHLWAAAAEGTRYTGHRAVSAWTAANIVSLLSGLSPLEHGVHTRGRSLAPAWKTALEDLAARGWRVAGLQPFMQVQVFDNLGLSIAPGENWRRWAADAALSEQPFVLWHHYLETHLPYAPTAAFMPDWRALLPEGDPKAEARVATVAKDPAIPAGSVDFSVSDRPAIETLYRAGVTEFDAWFDGFWRYLNESGLRRDTVVVLTSDHGEELLERGNVGHASTTRAAHLHEEIVHIPLIIWLPPGDGRLPAGGVVDSMNDHLDLMPTVLDLLGVEPTTALEGVSLLRGGKQRWFGMTSRGGYAEKAPEAPLSFVYGVIDGRWKLQSEETDDEAGCDSLYDLDADPGELANLAADRPEQVARLHALIETRNGQARRPAAAGVATSAMGPPPEWVLPEGSGSFGYDDLAGRFRLAWSGPADADYVLQYRVGEGLLSFDGTLDVHGTEKDFGTIERSYWETWVVPYSPYRVRVGYAGDDPRWSPWLDLTAKP
ncbi:MAG: hypothetical protein CMM50_13650 [Rhodospirillaceae bacterium]|nr:hypothetical protein [Rhodospirillaceae bacterium]